VSCHENDDAHNGSFGRQCERCHITKEWATVKPRVGAWKLPQLAAVLVPETPAAWKRGGTNREYSD